MRICIRLSNAVNIIKRSAHSKQTHHCSSLKFDPPSLASPQHEKPENYEKIENFPHARASRACTATSPMCLRGDPQRRGACNERGRRLAFKIAPASRSWRTIADKFPHLTFARRSSRGCRRSERRGEDEARSLSEPRARAPLELTMARPGCGASFFFPLLFLFRASSSLTFFYSSSAWRFFSSVGFISVVSE